MNLCPCGLTREELDHLPILVGSNGLCTAFDAHNQPCGKRLVDHPQSNSRNVAIRADSPSVTYPVNSFHEAMVILSQRNLIDSTNAQFSSLWLEANLGCATAMAFRGREAHRDIARKHIQEFSQITEAQQSSKEFSFRSPYLVVVGSSGSGKSRFLCEVGKDAQEKGYLVFATTFNHNTTYVPEDDLGLTFPQFPVVARLLYQYARNHNHLEWTTWCNRLIELNNIYPNLISFLELGDVVCFLKSKYSKQQVVLLIDETYLFFQAKRWKDSDIRNFMKRIMRIQDQGVAVIFSAFVAILVIEEGQVSQRQVERLNMMELSSDEVKILMSLPQDRNLLAPFSVGLGLDFDQTIELLYSCIGGLPRVVEGLTIQLRKLTHFEILSIVDAVGSYLAKRYSPPSFGLILAAFSNEQYPLDSVIKTQHGNYTIRDLQLHGFCTGLETGISISYAQLFAAVYSTEDDSTCVNANQQHIFRHVLKELLLIPIVRNHNIWGEFLRRLVLLRSLRYSNPTEIPLGDLFHPAIQVSECLTKTIILMTQIHLQPIRYFLPPSPEEVQRVPSIWFPDSLFESGVDTLLFFDRVPLPSSIPDEMEGGRLNNRICVGIQNKWSSDDHTKIAYSTMRNAVNHFTSKMIVQGWRPHQLYFIFIINQSIYEYVKTELHLLFNEQIGIISTTDGMLDQWLSPTVKLMVTRFHYPSHEIHHHNKTEEMVQGILLQTKGELERLKLRDQSDPNRKKHFQQGKERRSYEMMQMGGVE